jgi:hypothetical protein
MYSTITRCALEPFLPRAAVFFSRLTRKLGLFLLISLWAVPTSACMCQAFPTAEEEMQYYVNGSVAIVSGTFRSGINAALRKDLTLDEIINDPNKAVRELKFSTAKVWKGSILGAEIVILEDLSDLCSPPFGLDAEYILFLHGPDKLGRYTTSLCTGTMRFDNFSAEKINALKKIIQKEKGTDCTP